MAPDQAALREAGEALAPLTDGVTAGVLERYRTIRPDLMRQLDVVAVAAVERDVRHHLDFLVQALATGEPSLFDDYVGWAAVLFGGLGLPEEWLIESLEFVAQGCRTVLEPGQADVVDVVVRDAVSAMPDRGFTPPPFVIADGVTGALAVSYLDAALAGDRTSATQMALHALDDGLSIQDLYLQVIAPVQAEVGRLWLTSRVTVGQEHVATSVTQSVLGALSPRIGRTERIGRSVVIAAVGPELHEIGVRMVSDHFDLGGWDTHYLGANTPLGAIVSAVEEFKPDVVALSATMAPHLTDLRMAVEAVRRTEAGRGAKVIVGGRPFNTVPSLWRALDADGWAPEATGAVRTARTLCGA
ncbi:MAG: cobalamin-dependent protein [Coriobacteriia bacterium]|nr:cobalamin-dependent protein [Coriobacteriia bacterium]